MKGGVMLPKVSGKLAAVVVPILMMSAAGLVEARAKKALVFFKTREGFYAVKTSLFKNNQWNAPEMVLKPWATPLELMTKKAGEQLDRLNSLEVVNYTPEQLDAMKRDSSVLLVDEEVFHPLPRPVRGNVFPKSSFQDRAESLPGPKTPWGIKAVYAIPAWNESNGGEGAKVLILDTGLDKMHPSVRSNFELGKDFIENQGEEIKDLVGHGTHVAGTIAGVLDRSGFTGVAPHAKILAGRVCDEQGCSNVSIAKGINWGIEKNVDVVNMSLGGNMSTPSERMAISNALKVGVTIVAASGNDGVEKVSYPAALPGVIAVGAVDSKLKKAEFSQWGPELAVVAPGVGVVSSVPQGQGRESEVVVVEPTSNRKLNSTSFVGAREIMDPETNELIFSGLGKVEDFQKVNVSGKFALVQRGEIKFSEKVKNAIDAGAAGVIIYNNAPGLVQGALTDDGTVLPIGVFMIEQVAGEALKETLNSGRAVSITVRTIVTDYSSFDGTSMATPHVSGVVALMKAANKKLSPKQVKAILQSTATQLGPNDANQYGAGLVNAQKAVSQSLATSGEL
ncbi:MAG TPA: S8 family serine peptidase [Pseudobdellovibrionaceae bacterium]|nr:S8 family serine peptidase [Pseudobdellovibrionaceae bacterium]